MEKIISFIVDNWRLCAECVCALVALLLFVLRKKPVKVVDSRIELVLKYLPDFIRLAESSGLPGNAKKVKVLNLVSNFFRELGYEFTDFLREFTSKEIENILSTPQKKGD